MALKKLVNRLTKPVEEADREKLVEFCARNRLPYSFLDLESDATAEEMLRDFQVRPDETPIVMTSDGALRNPSNDAMAAAVIEAQVGQGHLGDLILDDDRDLRAVNARAPIGDVGERDARVHVGEAKSLDIDGLGAPAGALSVALDLRTGPVEQVVDGVRLRGLWRCVRAVDAQR